MSDPHATSFPLARAPHAPPPLYKQRSWSPDAYREEAWLRRKKSNGGGAGGKKSRQRSKSVTDEDLDELKGCIELGFGFDSPEPADQRLSDTLPALELYYAVNKHYNDSLNLSKPALNTTSSSSTATSDCDTPSPLGSPHTMFCPGDTPQTVKTRLRQWAQVVACSVRQCSS
ncbi:hypothetical protein L484_011069 [Morus notabilis]|uniref:Uncharacterized protein n=1 Tax=Morus notabilis TaxID=981085 RepID=W9QUE5_9ROSA|nr:uncharacterized protein LOC21394342 [Morus notabilis]EXB54406.1 hypothetical protein L484_011069 [Morus notabilis]